MYIRGAEVMGVSETEQARLDLGMTTDIRLRLVWMDRISDDLAWHFLVLLIPFCFFLPSVMS